jgi:hypothetical protein
VVSSIYHTPRFIGDFNKQQTLIGHIYHSGIFMHSNHAYNIPIERYNFYESNKSGFTQKEFVVNFL